MEKWGKFSRCEICQINHTQGRKHIYSKFHRQRIENILTRFGKKTRPPENGVLKLLQSLKAHKAAGADRITAKVKECKIDTQEVHIHTIDWEVNAKIWCYFCVQEVKRHECTDNATLQDALLLQHLSSADHSSKVDEFLKRHKMKLDEKARGRLMISAEHHTKYKEKVEKELRLFLDKQMQRRQNALVHYNEQKSRQKAVVSMAMYRVCARRFLRTHQAEADQDAMNESKQTYINSNEKHQGFRTVAAKGDGLTCISIPKANAEVGNVHSNAVPPWLRRDEKANQMQDASKSDNIGPSMETFQKHLASERKRKLPPNRVGAQQRETGALTADWLPSFGHVWSSRARTQQRKLRKATSTWTSQNQTFNDDTDITGSTNHEYSEPIASTSNSSYIQQNVNINALGNSYTHEGAYNGSHAVDPESHTNKPRSGNGSVISNGVDNLKHKVPVSGGYVRKKKPIYEQQATLIKIASNLL